MLFWVKAVDRPDHGAVRAAHRAAHLAYLADHAAAVRLAGPSLSEDGAAPTGSVLLLDLADRQAAEAFCAADPYAQAGLFAEVAITPWRQVIPAP